MSAYYNKSSRTIFEQAINSELDNIAFDDEVMIPPTQTKDLDLFYNDNDYNIVNNAFLNKNVNPFVTNYKTWQGLGDAAAQTEDDDEQGRVAFKQYDYDGIYDKLDKDYRYSIDQARVSMNNVDLDEEDRAWWTKRHKYVSEKYNSDKRENLLYGITSILGQTDDVLTDTIKYAAEFVPNFGIFATDLALGIGPRLVNHLLVNTLENAVTSQFFPAEYAEQTRINKLPQMDRKFELDLPFTDATIPSLAGFDGSLNDYLGKNWTQIHESISGSALKAVEQTYTSRLMANGNFRRGAETVRDFFGIGKSIKQAKKTYGKYIADNPEVLSKFEKIWNKSFKDQVRELGKVKGTLKYFKGKNAKNNMEFASDTLRGQQLRRQFDMSNTTLAWVFGVEQGLFEGKYSSVEVPTKWIPGFEFDVPLGYIAAPIVAGAGGWAVSNTVGRVPAFHAQQQLNAIARGQVLGTRKGFGLNPFREKMTIQEASTKFLLKSNRVTPEQINSIDKGINKFNMENAQILGEKSPVIMDQARRMQLGPEDYLYNEWVSGRLTDKRRVEAMYKDPVDRQAINSFNNKMDLLNLDSKTAQANQEMFMLYDEMSQKSSPLAQSAIEWTKTSIQTQDRIMSTFVNNKGEIQPRYKGIVEPSDITGMYAYFDKHTNLVMASGYRRLITEAGDLGPLGSRIDTILYNDLEMMSAMEEQALVTTNNALVTIVNSLGRNLNDMPKQDPLRIFLDGAQEAIATQQKSFTEYKETLATAGAQLKAIQQGAENNLNLSTISVKLGESGFDKPRSLIAYEENFSSLTKETGGTTEGNIQAGNNARGIADSRYDEIFGKNGIISKAYDVVRKTETVEQAPKIDFIPTDSTEMFQDAVGPVTGNTYVIFGSAPMFQIGRYGGDAGFVKDTTKFPDDFATFNEAVAEVQAVENIQFRKSNPSQTVTENKNLRETLNEYEIASGVILRENGEITLDGATGEGRRVRDSLLKGLKDAGIFEKNQGANDPTYIPNSVTVEDLVLARSIIKNKVSNLGVEAKGLGLDVTLTDMTNVLNQLPGYQKANETFQAYADVWFNNFGAELRAKQPGGKFELADFNVIEEFIRFGIKSPEEAAKNAFMYFGPSYKKIVAEGFAYALDNNRFNSTELQQLPVLLKSMFNSNFKISSQGEIITDRIGKDVEKISGLGGQVDQLVSDSQLVRIELNLDSTNKQAKAVKDMEDSINSQLNLDKVMFALTGGEERIVPFIKDFAGKSIDAMDVTANAIVENSGLDIAEVKQGLLTGLRETLMNDLVFGSEIAMVPAEKTKSGVAELLKTPKEGIATINNKSVPTPKEISERFGFDFGKVDVGRRGFGVPQRYGGKGLWNKKGFVTFQDEPILDQLNNKELEWTDVVKGWTSTLDKSLIENASLIEFLTTGEGAVSYLKDDIGVLGDLSSTQKNILDENTRLGSTPSRRPVNIPRKWTSAQITGWLNTYMKRITSRSYALGYASFQAIKMRNARFQVRMLTDPAIKESMESLFRGEPIGQLEPGMGNKLRGALIYLLPNISELYPEETDPEQIKKYKEQSDKVIQEMLREIGLAAKERRIDQGNATEDQMKSLNLN